VLVKLSGEVVNILCDVNNRYIPFIVMENYKKVLYMILTKSLYGCIQSAMLWYDTFKNCLENTGFKLNPYDPCVANKMIITNSVR